MSTPKAFASHADVHEKQVSFTQIPGGEVIDVRFMMCGYDEQGRESVEGRNNNASPIQTN